MSCNEVQLEQNDPIQIWTKKKMRRKNSKNTLLVCSLFHCFFSPPDLCAFLPLSFFAFYSCLSIPANMCVVCWRLLVQLKCGIVLFNERRKRKSVNVRTVGGVVVLCCCWCCCLFRVCVVYYVLSIFFCSKLNRLLLAATHYYVAMHTFELGTTVCNAGALARAIN